jgi:hypothetical protein
MEMNMPRLAFLCALAATLSVGVADAARADATSTDPGIIAERACAAMGLDPGSPQFGRCVSNLQQTIFDSRIVGNG